MKIIRLDEIIVPEDRQRKEFEPEALSDLCDDICFNGLQHAPVVRTTARGTELVSGERRLRCIRDLAAAGIPIRIGTTNVPLDHIPVTDFGSLSDREASVIELHENIKRHDLTWQERALAEAKLHEVRSDEAAEVGQKQTYTATAEELAGRKLSPTEVPTAIAEVRTSVVLAKALADPDVAAAKTAREALKIFSKKETERHYSEVAKSLQQTQTHDRHLLIKGDSKFLMGGLEAEKFDVLLCDPPYGIDAQNFGSQVFNEHKFDDSQPTWLDLMGELAEQSFRFCKSKAHAYVFCDPQHWSILHSIFKDAGWSPWRTPLIWHKGSGMLPRPEHGPRRCYESILYAIKGDKTTTGVYSDVLVYSPEKTTIHPDQKPVDLYVDLLRRSSRPGEFVVDPFAGSGTIFVAANKLQLSATGIEQEETSYAIATERLKER